MEASPLVKAHDHAREASTATHGGDMAAAVTKHTLAAGEFATAAGDTASAEALRTLRLLEEHHQRLSHILKLSLDRKEAEESRLKAAEKAAAAEAEKNKLDEKELSEKSMENDKPAPLGSATTTTSVSGVVTRGEFAGGNDGAASVKPPSDSPLAKLRNSAAAAKQRQALQGAQTNPSSPPSQQQQAQTNANRHYPPARELTSSIANNLASKRGIRGNGSPGPAAVSSTASARQSQRGQPAAPSVSNDLAPGSLGGSSTRGSRAQMQNVLSQQAKPSWVPPAPAVQTPSPLIENPPTMYVGTDSGDIVMHTIDSDDDSKAGEDAYSRFYTRFGSIINRLSAPLAFAGLPLVAEEAVEEAAPKKETQTQKAPRKGKENQRAPSRSRATSQLTNIAASAYSYYNSYGGAGGTDPDLSQIYSHAALRAIGAGGGNPNDSFYVVPKTGHTASYANILSFDQKEKRRMAASVHSDDMSEVGVFGRNRRASAGSAIAEEEEEDEHDDFVDAKERPSSRGSSTASKAQKGLRNRMHGGGAPGHVLEELYTENKGLKDMLDKLSRRLHAFEASAQSSHMALQESMRFMRPGSPSSESRNNLSGSASQLTPAAAAAAAASASAAASLKANRGAGSLNIDGGMSSETAIRKDMEDELARVLAKLEESERERAHQEKTLQKYREKWEKLKAGAKARRDAQPQ